MFTPLDTHCIAPGCEAEGCYGRKEGADYAFVCAAHVSVLWPTGAPWAPARAPATTPPPRARPREDLFA